VENSFVVHRAVAAQNWDGHRHVAWQKVCHGESESSAMD
jgi:hypothetical protein